MRVPSSALLQRGIDMSRVRSFVPAARSLLLFLVVLLPSAACSNANRDGGPAAAPQPQAPQATRLPTGAQSANEPEDGQWLMPAKNYASTRFSGLGEINAGN